MSSRAASGASNESAPARGRGRAQHQLLPVAQRPSDRVTSRAAQPRSPTCRASRRASGRRPTSSARTARPAATAPDRPRALRGAAACRRTAQPGTWRGLQAQADLRCQRGNARVAFASRQAARLQAQRDVVQQTLPGQQAGLWNTMALRESRSHRPRWASAGRRRCAAVSCGPSGPAEPARGQCDLQIDLLQHGFRAGDILPPRLQRRHAAPAQMPALRPRRIGSSGRYSAASSRPTTALTGQVPPMSVAARDRQLRAGAVGGDQQLGHQHHLPRHPSADAGGEQGGDAA